jgi:hypothetical protein
MDYTTNNNNNTPAPSTQKNQTKFWSNDHPSSITTKPSTWHSSPRMQIIYGQTPPQQQQQPGTIHTQESNPIWIIWSPILDYTQHAKVMCTIHTEDWNPIVELGEWVWDLGRPMPGSVSMMTFFGATKASIATTIATTIADCLLCRRKSPQSSNPAHNQSAKKSETQNNLPHSRTPDLRSGARASDFTRNSLDRFRWCQVWWRPARLQHASRGVGELWRGMNRIYYKFIHCGWMDDYRYSSILQDESVRFRITLAIVSMNQLIHSFTVGMDGSRWSSVHMRRL